jgi:hypothetical protein
MEELRRFWVKELGATCERTFVLDTKPVPVVGYTRER